MDKQIYVTLWTIKQHSSKLVQEYYERILKLTSGINIRQMINYSPFLGGLN
jgi:hypothetical protein